jgi:acyl-[acyl-carrier-protein] desaturase
MERNKRMILRLLKESIANLVEVHIERRGDIWMPGEIVFLESASHESFLAHIREWRERASSVPPAVRAAFALNLLTENGLPSYFLLLAEHLGLEYVFKEWICRWTAEEDRHAQLLGDVARISGLLPNLAALERERFVFLGKPFRPDWHGDPYCLLAYTAVQEELTKIAHGVTSVYLKEHGGQLLAEPSARVASDENHHARFSFGVVKCIADLDPDRMLVSLWHAFKNFEMPGASIPSYRDLADVAMRLGVLTWNHTASVLEKLLLTSGLAQHEPRTAEAADARENLLKKIVYLRRGQRLVDERNKNKRMFTFPFLGDVAFEV